jgi:hypothetical protein
MKKFNSTPGLPGRQRGNDLNRKLKGETTMKHIIPFILVVVLLTGCQTNTFTHKQFPERVIRIHTIGLLPQVHTAMLNTYFGKDPSPAPFPEEPQFRSELIASTIEQLQQHGFVVKEGSFPGSSNLTWNGRMIQQACSTLLSKEVRPDAKALADNMNVDGLIFLDATAYKSTPHRQNVTTAQNIFAVLGEMVLVASAVAGGSAPAGSDMLIAWQDAALQISLVDGKTGEVLWTTADSFYDFDMNKPAKAVEGLFNRYPKQKP